MSDTIELKISLLLRPRMEMSGKRDLYVVCSCRNVIAVTSIPLTSNACEARISAVLQLSMSTGIICVAPPFVQQNNEKRLHF